MTVPPMVEPTSRGTLGDLAAQIAAETPELHLILRRDEHDASRWHEVTAAQFAADVTQVAKGLVAAGIGTGDRVGLMCRTRYEWTLVDFAIWTAGAVTVPIYETSSAEQVEWIVNDSGAKAIVVETAAHASTVAECRATMGTLVDVWQIDGGSLDELRSAGRGVSDEQLTGQRAGLDRSSVATVIYTSGTTGRPKGCELTHGNFLDLSENTVESLGSVVAAPGASTLLFLPLAHVFARFIQVLVIVSRAQLAHTPDVSTLLPDLDAVKPTFILAVPRVFEKIYNSAELRAESNKQGHIFHRAVNVAIAWSEAQDTGGPSLALRAQHFVFDRLVYGKLRAAMGGHVQYAVSGGAPLGTRLGHFFRGIGVVVLEGYGLTETTAPVAVNRPEKVKIGTVGIPLPGMSVRIGEDGEVLTRGIGVFAAYWQNTQATADAFTDGWFHTGDLGGLDDDGYLRITGRKKEILVTAAGKNVAPAVLEDRLRAHPIVSQCIVVGDGKPFIGALVTLDAEMYPGWAEHHGLGDVSFEQAPTDERVHAAVQEGVDRANRAVSKAESIRKFVIVPEDFTEENGTLTPSLKLRRSVVMQTFAPYVEQIYERPTSAR